MSSKSNFQKVQEFNKVFGVPRTNKLYKNVFDDDKKLVKLRLDLIKEEVGELEEAIQNKDMKEVIDALSDILYVVYGAGDSFGIDLDHTFDMVHSSNMSKSCNNEELAIRTVEDYQKKYDAGNSPYDSPAYRFDEESGLYIVYNKNTGKILKSIEYNAVNFDSIVDSD